MEKQKLEEQEIENFNLMKGALLTSTDRDRHLYSLFLNHGSRICENHNSPSKKTMEEITNIKIDLKEVMGDVKHLKETVEKHVEKEDRVTDELREIVSDFMNSAESKFANKWIEKLIIFLASTAGVSIIGGGCYFIYKLFEIFIKHQ